MNVNLTAKVSKTTLKYVANPGAMEFWLIQVYCRLKVENIHLGIYENLKNLFSKYPAP